MKNNWIGKVLGEAVVLSPPQPAKPAPSILKQVLGEEEEKPKTEPKEKPKTEEPPKAAETEPAPAADVDTAVVEPGDPDHVSDPVQALASLWTSGGKMDVAIKLLTEPVSYGDFVGLVLAIGNESALELGQILDDMVEGQGDGAPPADNILSRVDGFKKQRTDGEAEEGGLPQRSAEDDLAAVTQRE